MNTATPYNTPMLKQIGKREYVFILEDLELAFPKQQLEEITYQWNSGMELEHIAEFHRRDPREVFLALFHQADKGLVTRPFAYRKVRRK